MDCRELRAMMDSYISDELLVETNHEVLRHLENCPDCRREMSECRSLKLRLRHTVRSAADTQMDPIFAARTTTNLRDMALRPSAWDRFVGGGRYLNMRVVAVGFASILVLALGGVVLLNRSNSSAINAGTQTPASNNKDTSDLAKAVRVSWQEMTSQAVGDHKNCAIEFNLKEHPISLDEAAQKYGAYNKDLDKVIKAALKIGVEGGGTDDTQFIKAHSCLFEGRRFAHIVVKHKGRVVSLLVTDTDLPAGNDDIQTAHFDGAMNVAGFHVGHHAAFIVSESADADNVRLAEIVAPAIRLHAEKLGA